MDAVMKESLNVGAGKFVDALLYEKWRKNTHREELEGASKLNCEVLYDDLAFEVRWAVAGDSIVLQLVAKLDNGEYMSFGISGEESHSSMIGGDVAVAWVDKETLKGYAEDYYLEAKSQCSGPTGSCPDNRLRDSTNNIRLLNAAMVNGYSIVTYQRPLRPSDEFDRQIYTNKSQAVIWAIGPLNQRKEVSFHSKYTKGDRFLDFGRPAKWNCPMPEVEQPPMKALLSEVTQRVQVEQDASTSAPRIRNSERRRGSSNAGRGSARQEVVDDSEKSASRNRVTEKRGGHRGAQRENTAVKEVPTPAPVSKRNAWEIPPIQCYEPDDGVFYAQMGPTGGKRGYPAITGHVGWGISWYINGLLIPEINVVRGKSYTFVVEGGFDPEVPAKYHPFYITDDPVGGYEYKTQEERKNIRIFAGARTAKDGAVLPTGTGRLCHWTPQGDSEADDFESFGAYQRTLELKCDQGEPGVIQWTPDKDTPDTVYYQCFTHRYLGWKINVHDSCEERAAASEPKPALVPAPDHLRRQQPENFDADLEESPSVRIETRVKPNDIFIKEDKEDKDFKPTVSEKKTNPKLDLPQSNGQPNQELPQEPILIQTPQNYYNPFYVNHGPFNIYNPYAHETPFQNHPYEQTFRPSPPLDSNSEEFKADISVEPDKDTTSTTTSTTTDKPSTTAKPVTVDKDKLLGAASDLKPINQTSLPQLQMMPPKQFANNKILLRRPLGPPVYFNRPQFSYPMKLPLRPLNMPMRQFSHQISFKTPGYRPFTKIPVLNRHQLMPLENKPMLLSGMPIKRQPSPLIVQKLAVPSKVPFSNTNHPHMVETSQIKHIEISPQKASTEKEPEIQTAGSASTSYTTEEYKKEKLKHTHNRGFRPDSLIIESGFKPIISKGIQNRFYEEDPELDRESEIGVIRIDGELKLKKRNEPLHLFEPMFVPSPIDKHMRDKLKIHKRPYYKKAPIKFIWKRPRSLDDPDEPIAEAAERVESYYLPPLGQTIKPEHSSHQTSNIDVEDIDIDSPPDVVVTYDGKRVSGASLTKLSDRTSVLDMRASKAAEFIKAGPQSAPFKGELPPLNPQLFNKDAPQLASSGTLRRDLDTPPLPPPIPRGSTKLRLVQHPHNDEKKSVSRRKREAHHTPEHTAQQEKEKNAKNSSNSDLLRFVHLDISIIVVACFLNYL